MLSKLEISSLDVAWTLSLSDIIFTWLQAFTGDFNLWTWLR